MEPDLSDRRGPDPGVLERLNMSSDSITYRSFAECSSNLPLRSPLGEGAALVWLEPIEGDRPWVQGGWYVSGDEVGWGCELGGVDDVVEVERCEKLWES
jgi:hypothetical protein